MREYLFKAKTMPDDFIGSPKWIESHRIGSVYIRCAFIGGVYCYPESVGMYTGFFDENNKKIFEGDIIEWIDTRENYDEKDCTGVVEWNKNIGLWEVRNDRMHIYDFLCHIHAKSDIIGTYFDNPELLEGLKEK